MDSTSSVGCSASGDMAALNAINLGTGRTAAAIDAGNAHTCAVLDNGDAKCWGSNWYGGLGQDTTSDIGSSSGDMAALNAINLGSGRTAVAIAASTGYHTCVLLDDSSVKVRLG